jgi:CheY-like chemotaxis protein
MQREELYVILQNISRELAASDKSFIALPDNPNWDASLEDLGIDLITGQEYFAFLEKRIPTKAFKVPAGILDRLQGFGNLGELCDYLLEKGFVKREPREVVYVDDEPENLFVFKRRFGKMLNLKTFEDPIKALSYILENPQIGLVITDEVMPKMNGNELCDETKKRKPDLRFILITGNPNGDEDLLHRTLRKGRFYEFINKPVDFEKKGDEYLAMIQGLLDYDW